MKVILKQDVKGLGKADDMVNVSDGYARNYLLPRGLAALASAENLNIMKMKKAAAESRKGREMAHAKDQADKMKDIVVTIKAKAGENGKLFGSITNKDIADKLKADFNLDIDRKKIILPDPIKSLGTLVIDIKLYPEIITKLTVNTVQE